MVLCIAAWKVTSSSWAALKGRYSEMAGFGAFSERKCGRDSCSMGGGTRGLQPGSRWFTCHLLHLRRDVSYGLVKWSSFVLLTAVCAAKS